MEILCFNNILTVKIRKNNQFIKYRSIKIKDEYNLKIIKN